MARRREIVGEAMRQAAAEVDRQHAAADGEQLSMFRVPSRFRGSRAEHLQRELETARQAGRPAGAENLSNQALRKYLLQRGKHPLQSLMEWSLYSPHQLAAELKCTPLEAFRELRQVWAELAPFFAGKLGYVDDDGRPVPLLQMLIAGERVAIAGDGAPPWELRERLADMQQNQGVTGPPAAVSHAPVSHGEGK